jgi:hypothetical protein
MLVVSQARSEKQPKRPPRRRTTRTIYPSCCDIRQSLPILTHGRNDLSPISQLKRKPLTNSATRSLFTQAVTTLSHQSSTSHPASFPTHATPATTPNCLYLPAPRMRRLTTTNTTSPPTTTTTARPACHACCYTSLQTLTLCHPTQVTTTPACSRPPIRDPAAKTPPMQPLLPTSSSTNLSTPSSRPPPKFFPPRLTIQSSALARTTAIKYTMLPSSRCLHESPPPPSTRKKHREAPLLQNPRQPPNHQRMT